MENNTEVYYFDDNDNMVEPDKATKGVIRELDENGNLIRETWGKFEPAPQYDDFDEYIKQLEEEELNVINVYPNPANNVVNVNANSNINNVEIYSISGQKVGDFSANGTTTSINTESLSAGMYLMKINTENGVINKKFSVAR